MRKMAPLVLCLLVGCGGANSSPINNSPSVSVPDGTPSYFYTGSYLIREGVGCEGFPVIDEFRISEGADYFALGLYVIQGNASIPSGSSYMGIVNTIRGRNFANFGLLGCSGTLVADTQENFNASHNLGIDVQLGDMLVTCGATATTRGCMASYQRESLD